jgi:hypothetical protein
MTFAKLKRTLQRASGIPSDYIRLYFQEGLLADEGYLTDVTYSSDIELEMQIEEPLEPYKEEREYGREQPQLLRDGVDRGGPGDHGEPFPPPPPPPYPPAHHHHLGQMPQPYVVAPPSSPSAPMPSPHPGPHRHSRRVPSSYVFTSAPCLAPMWLLEVSHAPATRRCPAPSTYVCPA